MIPKIVLKLILASAMDALSSVTAVIVGLLAGFITLLATNASQVLSGFGMILQ